MIATILTIIGVILFVLLICVGAILLLIGTGLIVMFLALAVGAILGILETIIWMVVINLGYMVVWVIDYPFKLVRKLVIKIKDKGEEIKESKGK